jgi:hypothetical protein
MPKINYPTTKSPKKNSIKNTRYLTALTSFDMVIPSNYQILISGYLANFDDPMSSTSVPVSTPSPAVIPTVAPQKLPNNDSYPLSPKFQEAYTTFSHFFLNFIDFILIRSWNSLLFSLLFVSKLFAKITIDLWKLSFA